MTSQPSAVQRLWLLALVPYGWLLYRFQHVIDDAYISFRYAENWAAGSGLTYNPGIDPPVEGFSNFLWVALLAIGGKAGVAPENLALVLSGLAGLALIYLVQRFAHYVMGLQPLHSGLAAIFLAAFPPFTIWCSGGLETGLFTLLLFASWSQLCRVSSSSAAAAGLLAIALCATRPEGIMWSLGLLLASFLALEDKAEWRKRALRYSAILAVGVVALLVARYSYFGEWLPNTFYAKSGSGSGVYLRGLKVVASFFIIFLSPIIVLGLIPSARRIPARRLVDSSALMFFAGLAFNVATGGDWMQFFRFIAPLTPFLALLFGAGLERFSARPAALISTVTIALGMLPVFDLHIAPTAARESVYFRTFSRGYETEYGRFDTAHQNRARYSNIGHALAEVANPGESLVYGAIGAVGYYSGVLIHDRNGLVDYEVARGAVKTVRSAGHDKRVPRHFFSEREPTWYDATYVPGDFGQQKYRVAVNVMIQKAMQMYPSERVLFDLCKPVRIRFDADHERLPTGSLIVLEATNSKGEARAGWRELGLLSE